MTTTAKYDPSTAAAIFDRDQRRWERKVARQNAEAKRRLAYTERTRQLGQAVAAMASRRVQSARRERDAFKAEMLDRPALLPLGKGSEHWNRAVSRQHIAMLRLLYALEDHANKKGA